MKIARFELEDCEGGAHQYEVELFSCDENARLQLMCAQPLLKAIARLIGTVAPALGEEGLDGAMASTEAMIQALGRMDMDLASDALAEIPQMVETRGGPELVAQVFKRTARLVMIPEIQSQPTISDRAHDGNLRQALKDSGQRDLAFGDGNYGEYWMAFAMVLAVNFTRIGRSGSATWRTALEGLTGGLLTRSTATTATAEQSPATSPGSSPRLS